MQTDRRFTPEVIHQIQTHRGWLTGAHLAEVFGTQPSYISQLMRTPLEGRK